MGNTAEARSEGRSVFAAWEAFAKVAIPAGAGMAQREALRRAFYMGAGLMFQEVCEFAAAMEFDEGAVEEFRGYLDGVAEELTGFVTDMRVPESLK